MQLLAEGVEKFLSTLSLRRATAHHIIPLEESTISIHALLAESDLWQTILPMVRAISIHALLAESDSGSLR